METLEELKAIIAGAPEGATHICLDGGYYRCNNKVRNGKQWDFLDSSQIGRADRWDWVGDMYLSDILDMRSLSDIERIIELMESVEQLEDDIAVSCAFCGAPSE